MTGLDWDKLGKRYEALLPWVAHRSDLNYIIGEMISELSTSHTYVGGGDMPERKQVNVGLLGVDFAPDGGFYKLAKIYRGENWSAPGRSPLTEPGLKVKAGNYLIAVNGQVVRTPAEPYSFFQNLADQVVTRRSTTPSEEGAWEISVKPYSESRSATSIGWRTTAGRWTRPATDASPTCTCPIRASAVSFNSTST
jgi:tricorn protease